ncbi:MAG: baseplate J/gp47 family protein [Desulfobulbus sp.]|jgi:uncharacterized phage protein gp47/JayE
MSFAAEPYGVFVDDLVSALTGGVVREEFVYPPPAEAPRLSAGDQYVPESVRLHGIADGAFRRFVLDRDYKIDSKGTISWLTDAATATLPDAGSRFYLSYETKPGYRRRPALTDRNPGSILRLLAESFAREYAVLSRQLEMVYRAAFLETAENRDLDQVAALVGIQRRDHRHAAGEVIFSRSTPAPADVVIPEGSLISTADAPPITVETLEQAILRAGSLSVAVPVRSSLEGSAGKAGAGTLTIIHRPVLGIESATNPHALDFRGGREEDAMLRRRAARALETSGRATVRALTGALMTIEGLREEDISVKEDHVNHPGVVRVTIAADLDDRRAARAVELIEAYRPAGIRVQHNLKVSPPATLAAGAEPRPPSTPPPAPLEPSADSVWHPVGISVAVLPADAALTTAQKARIGEQVRQAVRGYVDGLGIDRPLIHSQLLHAVMGVEGVFDIALEVFDRTETDPQGRSTRRTNLQPRPDTRIRLDDEALQVVMRGGLIALDLNLTVKRKGLRVLDTAAIELSRVRDEALTRLNAFIAAGPTELTRESLEKTLGGSPNFEVKTVSFLAEFIEEGLRLRQANLPITVGADQQPWLRRVVVSDPPQPDGGKP